MTVQRSNPDRPRTNFYPPWSPRFWHGMNVPSYVKLLSENGFRIHPTRIPMAIAIGAFSLFNWVASGVQHLLFGRRIRNTQIEKPPLFILGHWRSGTTLLHELLALDPELAYPSNLDTFTTQHSLITRWFVHPLLTLVLPGRRPMDSMRLQPGSPQEDDMALISLGAPTPYRRIAFPNQANRLHEQLDSDNMTDEQSRDFSQALTRFFQILTLRYQRRLLLKSPPHTGRIQLLARLFPGALFVHISRDPMRMVPSTLHLWRSIDEVQAFQVPRYDESWLRNYVTECKNYMYGSYFRGRTQIDPHNLVEIQFEQLVADPAGTLERIYRQFDLPGLPQLLPLVEAYFEKRKNHKSNRLDVPEALQQDIQRHWQDYRREFGYEFEPSGMPG